MKQLLLSLALILALSGVVVREGSLQNRIEELSLRPEVDPRLVDELHEQVAQLERSLAATREELGKAPRAGEVEELEGRFACLESELGATGREVASYSARLSDWESQWSGHEPTQFDLRLAELRRVLELRGLELDELAQQAAQVAAEDRQRIEALDRSLLSLTERDMSGMWKDLVGPVVQISGESTVGSGVLLESTPVSGSDAWKTNLLTSWHVVRDIYSPPDRLDAPIPIRIYLEDGSTKTENAVLRAYDVDLDLALLQLEVTERVPYGARLPSRARLSGVKVFDAVYAVGCPLGNDPIPTAGEIASTNHHVDGSSYWMISAPTYIGNSGGGIFDARSHELLGIFSKIYTHGSLRSTIVPHMGLVTPMPAIYAWFESIGYLELAQVGELPPAAAEEAALSTTQD
jgi:S1-C subfamily serine protease